MNRRLVRIGLPQPLKTVKAMLEAIDPSEDAVVVLVNHDLVVEEPQPSLDDVEAD